MRLNNLFFILLSSALFSQTSFNYQRDWATYVGAIDTGITGLYEDSYSHIFVDARTSSPNPSIGTPPVSYYNQFITAGSQPYTGSYTIPNNFSGTLTSAGSLISAGYSPYITSDLSAKFPYFRDHNGNRYELQTNPSNPALPPGAWLSNAPESLNNILTKYDVNNTMLWQTYLPGNDSFNKLDVDDDGNIYVAGATKWQNLADPGTFQPVFSMVYGPAGELLPNTYLVKLNPQGQKIWATYTPSSLLSGLTVSGDKVYICGNNDLKPAGADLSTSGTFQPAKAGQFIAEINASTGQRTWGTYYGIPGNTLDSGISDIKADGTGVYITGATFGVPGSYYATEGAYKTQSTDPDMFVTKFNSSGGRIWSTYIGTAAEETFSGDRGLDIKNGKVLFTGLSYGDQNISTPGAYIATKPNPNGQDIFFSMLDSSTGFPDFISYYGGTSNSFHPNDIQCIFSIDSDGFYLYGSTGRSTGFSSANGYQQTIIYPGGITTGISGFIAKFSPKTLSASEADPAGDLMLYNNPNNGNFSIKGTVLQQVPHMIVIHDVSGRLLYSRPIKKSKEEHFRLEHLLAHGNYIVSVTNSDLTVVKTFKLMIRK